MTGDAFVLLTAALAGAIWGALVAVVAVQDERFRNHLLLVAAASVLLVARIPAFTGAQVVVQTLVVGALLAATALVARRRVPWSWSAAAIFFYVALIAVGLLRGAREGVYQTVPAALVEATLYVTVVVFALALVSNADDDETRDQRLAALALAPAVYCIANALLFLAGVTSRAELGLGTTATTSFLEIFGVSTQRVQFAFATAVNSMGIISAIGVASCIVLLARGAAPRWITIPGLLASSLCLLYSDTRAALILGLIVAAWFAWSRRQLGAKTIALIVPFLPLALMWLISQNRDNWVSDLLSRDAGDFAKGNGRVEVWALAWNTVGDVSPQHLIGWGANGHITSGASFDYAKVFGGQDQPWRYSTHDIALQTVLDTGLLGLAALMIAIAVSATALQAYGKSRPVSAAPALLAIIGTAVLCGVTEVSPSYGTQEALLATLLAMGAAMGLVHQKRALVTVSARAHTGSAAPRLD